jgi:hypothetical protein
MTMDTEKLIERLAEVVEPVRPLARPWIRTAAWLLVAVPYVALIVFVVSPRADLISKASEWRYVIEQLAALATGITAATAAFRYGHPRVRSQISLPSGVAARNLVGKLGRRLCRRLDTLRS